MPGWPWSWWHGKKEREWKRRDFTHTVDPDMAERNAKKRAEWANEHLFNPASRTEDDKIRDAGRHARKAVRAGYGMTRPRRQAIHALNILEQEELEAQETRKRRPNTARVSSGRTSDAALPTNTDLRTLQIRF